MKSVNVTCATYRDPQKDCFIRTYGVISLINQMMNQDYGGDITIFLVDDSPEPHVFARKIAEDMPERVSYVHAPSRHLLRAVMGQKAPDMAMLVPTDEELKMASLLLMQDAYSQGQPVYDAEQKLVLGDFNLSSEEWDGLIGKAEAAVISDNRVRMFIAAHDLEAARNNSVVRFWKQRLSEVRSYAALVPFEEDYPYQPNIYAQVFGSRPTIGMKKNAGNALGAAQFGKPDVLVYADDDDLHGPDYVARSVEALGDCEFTRMTRYLTYIFNKQAEQSRPGIFDLPVKKNAAGFWELSYAAKSSAMFLWIPQKQDYDCKTIGAKFSRPVTLAWPILSHEGALHTYLYDTWERSVETIGGASPVSFCEDIIYYRALKNHYGAAFDDNHTPIKPGEEVFVRIADGANQSIIEVTEHINRSDMPNWAKEATAFLHTAQKNPYALYSESLLRLADVFSRQGRLTQGQLLSEGVCVQSLSCERL